ncbi:MAG: Asp/Glu racemase [Clostridiales bacterium]|nr:Asp/Glu racemase [Clostridiales bacterium]
MAQKVGIVHTTINTVFVIRDAFVREFPMHQYINIIDDSMVAEVVSDGVTPHLIYRLTTYYRHCENLGCAAILNQCTSAVPAAEIAAKSVKIPVFHIDRPMAREAVSIGRRIGIVATAISTLEPSRQTFEMAAKELGEAREIKVYYCEGAHTALFQHRNQELHDQRVYDTAKLAAKECDVLALAQCSMASLAPRLSSLGVPVLTSIDSGIRQLRAVLEE